MADDLEQARTQMFERRRRRERDELIRRLSRKGLTLEQAAVLVDDGVSVHDVEAVLKAGCDPSTAFKIFR